MLRRRKVSSPWHVYRPDAAVVKQALASRGEVTLFPATLRGTTPRKDDCKHNEITVGLEPIITDTNTDYPRDAAILDAFDRQGQLIEQIVLTFDQYYEDLNPIIDEDEYRVTNGITKLVGNIYDDEGIQLQSFINHYDNSGAYIGGRGRVTHEDGTVHIDSTAK